MSGRFFLDTNIFVYAVASDDRSKQRRSIELVAEAHQSGKGVVSYQVVQEWFNVVLRKAGATLSLKEALPIYHEMIEPLWRIESSRELIHTAIELHGTNSFSWWDSLIVSAAIQGACDRLLSEDLEDSRTIRGMRISNPFI